MSVKEENPILSVLAEKVNYHADWHEYAAYYSCRVKGVRKEALKLMEQARLQIDALQSEERKRRWEADYLFNLELIQNYIAWQKSGTSLF